MLKWNWQVGGFSVSLTLLMEEILHQLIWKISHHWQVFYTSKRWFSRQDFWSINSRVTYMGGIWCLFDTHLFLSKDLGCFTTHHQETGKECGIGNMWHWGVEIEPPDALMLLKHLEEISIWNDGGAIPIEIHELSGAYLTVFFCWFLRFFLSSWTSCQCLPFYYLAVLHDFVYYFTLCSFTLLYFRSF